MDIEIRRIREEEIDEYFTIPNFGWGRPDPTEEDLQWLRRPLELDRTHAAFENGRIVATVGTNSLQMRVPGNVLRLGGIYPGIVTKQTHRRRGLMSRMMRLQLRDMYDRGEPLSALRASESIIYGGFGYGVATFEENWSIRKHETAFATSHEITGAMRLVDGREARGLLPPIYERVSSGYYGMLVRGGTDWDRQLFGRRGLPTFGDTSRQMMYAIYERDGVPDGYMLYQAHPNEQWIRVYELMADSTESHAALWRFAFDLDLIRTIEAYDRPPDDALFWMLADPRMLRRSPSDATWLRLVDVRTALSDRVYFAEGQLNLQVIDAVCPWNEDTWRLSGGPDGAHCSADQGSPDIVLSAADLAAVYLGSTSFKMLAKAGRVQERTSRALHHADLMFLSGIKPWGPFH